jgi:uroporphyrinogen III methyltransferase/synthase
LLTRHATDAIAAADVVVADAAVPPSITSLASVDVQPAQATAADTVKALLAEARAGHSVVRLVAGDPFLDDEAVREALAVAKTVVPFDVVPGIPLGAGTASYAGVPVGSIRTEAELTDVETADYEALAQAAGTLVVTVDAADVGYVGEQLVAYGLKPDTPVAVSCHGTTTAQQTVVGQLGDLELSAVGMTGRVVLTLGKAAAMREKLGWWESRPLYGWKVLVPRT